MFRKKYLYIIALALLIFLSGCSDGNGSLSPDVIATINGHEITTVDIRKEIELNDFNILVRSSAREIFQYLEPNEQVESFLNALGKSMEQLSYEEKRYTERIIKTHDPKPLSPNEAFNNVARNIILYEAAKKQGFEVSVQETRELLKEMEKGELNSFEQDSEELILFQRARLAEDEAAKSLGYLDANDFREQRMELIAKSFGTGQLNNHYEQKIREANLEMEPIEFIINSANAWEDYGESLLKKAKIDIIDKDYSIKYRDSN